MGSDPSIIEEFVVEAQEHLENIEDDFLELGQQQDDPDPALIDKIFRAAHSIKGGAGFLQLTNIGGLAHIMETLLSSIRSGTIAINGEIIDALLAGVDKLGEMLADVDGSNAMDISLEHGRLDAILKGATGGPAEEVVVTNGAGQETGFEISSLDLKNIPKNHEFLYVLHYDLAELQKRGKSPVAFIRELLSTGEIVDARIDAGSDDLKDGLPQGPLHYDVLYSSLIGPETIELAVGLAEDKITVVDRGALEAAAPASKAGTPEPSASSSAPPPTPGPAPEAPKPPVNVPPPPPEIDEQFQIPVTPEMIEQFVAESDETLETVEQILMEVFEQPESSEESIAEAFRLIHSFKGNCGLLGYRGLEHVSHTMETVLDFFKRGVTPRREADRTVLMKGVDTLREGVGELSETGTLAPRDHTELLEELASLLPQAEPPRPQRAPAPARRAPAEPREAEAPGAAAKKTVERRDLRVDLEKLDVLINLVGELVIAESMTTRHPDLADLHLEGFERSAHNLRRIIADLQDVAMQVRMIPLSRTFRKMIRLVHDLSAKAGKLAKLELIGEDTEVDKTVIEQIADPLVHIIRNSVDHGLEPPAEREAHGKTSMGTVTIEAKHEGGEVLIVISDDGRGLSREKIVAKARANGLISGDGANIPDDEIFKLIFEPGFSTAEQITDISGRGVGMDVVKRNLEKLKGRVDVTSQLGKGTHTILRIPLTLAIIEGMLIRVGSSQYTLPLLSIRESFRPEAEQITTTMDGQEVVSVREEMIPVVRLHEMYRLKPDTTDLCAGILVIVESGRKRVCIFADEILGQHQTVIKGLPAYLGKARGLSGCTILGNGEVSLILDVGSLIAMAENFNFQGGSNVDGNG
jgi:two-component system chemotaxis sensor kinase CheA